MKKLILVIVLLTALVSCSRIQNTDLEKTVKVFLTDFQRKLQGPDEEILKLFAGTQSREEILKAISILQNKDSVVKVKLLFDSIKSYPEASYVVVELPLDLTGRDQQIESMLSFQLFKNDGQFRIGKLEGERLYQDFSGFKNRIENADELARRMADMKVYYDRAHELQKDYDSVIWYVHHKNMTYYYAVKGTYNFDLLKNETPQDYKMGLIDETGKIIVPVDFDLIGNPSMTLSEAVEVRKNGKIGYFTLDGKEIIEASYDWLVPYEKGFANALVKKDSTFGWLDKDYGFHENFPSEEAERSIKEFEYLTNNTFAIGNGHQDLINVMYPLAPDFHNGGMGLVIPSAYFVKMGIFSQIDEGFVTQKSEKLYAFGNDYTEMKSQKPFSISDMLSGIIAEINNRYIGGRGEFYNRQKILLVNERKSLVSTIDIPKSSGIEFKKINDSLFQYTYLANLDFVESPVDNLPEINYPAFGYFKYDGKKLTHVTSRRFGFTEFVKMDSSYLKGEFDFYNNEKFTKTNFLSTETMRFMRNEILASYGLIFTDPAVLEQFKYIQWYKPTMESYDEVYAKLSEIDKYNLDFLARILGPYEVTNPS